MRIAIPQASEAKAHHKQRHAPQAAQTRRSTRRTLQQARTNTGMRVEIKLFKRMIWMV